MLYSNALQAHSRASRLLPPPRCTPKMNRRPVYAASGLWLATTAVAASLLLGRGDDDFHERCWTAQLDCNARTGRWVLGVDPGAPRLIHRILLLHVRDIDSRRDHVRFVGTATFEIAIDFLQYFLGLL